MQLYTEVEEEGSNMFLAEFSLALWKGTVEVYLQGNASQSLTFLQSLTLESVPFWSSADLSWHKDLLEYLQMLKSLPHVFAEFTLAQFNQMLCPLCKLPGNWRSL